MTQIRRHPSFHPSLLAALPIVVLLLVPTGRMSAAEDEPTTASVEEPRDEETPTEEAESRGAGQTAPALPPATVGEQSGRTAPSPAPTEEARPDEDASSRPTSIEDLSLEIDEQPVVDEALQTTALLFFQALIAGIPEAIVEIVDYPFNLDGEVLENRTQLLNRLRELFRGTDMSRLPLYGLQAYPIDVMKEEFGPPPRRLREADLDDSWVAVANLGGHGYVAVFREEDGAWRAIAYSE